MANERQEPGPPPAAMLPVAAAGCGSEEPLLGGYFVSAYPPFAFWTETGASVFERRLDRPDATGGLTLYVHFPFCAERCQFCYYLSHDDRPAEIEGYIKAVLREARLAAERPLLAGRALDCVYFGGGTPSLLSVERLRRLIGGLQSIFRWVRPREVTFECAPRSVTAAKLEVLRELGVTRISLGVQELDNEVLRQNGRIHLVADVERAVERIQAAGFEVLNVDLISGLVGQTDASFRASLERVVEMAPESVTIYLLEIPHNTPLYRAIRDGTAPLAPAGWEIKRARLLGGFACLEKAGYTVRSAYTAVRDPRRHAFIYQDAQYQAADVLGIGVSAFSYLAGVHHQNRADLESYLASLAKGRLPLWRGYELDAEARLVRELVLQLKLGGFDAGRLREKYGVDPRHRFAAVIDGFRDRGWLTGDGEAIDLTREGLCRVDRMIEAFYLPQHRSAPG